jgi:hypothetical protein
MDMTDGSIPKKVLQGLGQVAEEAGKEVVSEVIKLTESVITPKELLGDIKPMTDGELAQKKAEDDKKKQDEAAKLQHVVKEPARNVGQEIEEVRQEEEQKEDEEEKKFLEEIRLQREQEEAERQQMASMMQVSSNPAKQKKSAGSAFVQGKKKSQQPDPSQMSQTAEFSGKID